MGRRAAGLPQEAAPVHGLPRDAEGKRPGHGGGSDAGPLARAGHDRGVQGGRGYLRTEAHQRGRRGRAGHAGGGAEIQARGAGGDAAPEHAAPDRGAADRAGGEARDDRARGDLFLWRRAAEPGNAGAGTGDAGLGVLDGAGAADAVQPGHPARLAVVHGIRQRHHRGHGNPHVRHGALVHGSGLAEAHIVVRRAAHSEGREERHPRYADRHVRVRQRGRGLAASALRALGGPELSVGRHALRREGHAEGRGVRLRFHSGRDAASSRFTKT